MTNEEAKVWCNTFVDNVVKHWLRWRNYFLMNLMYKSMTNEEVKAWCNQFVDNLVKHPEFHPKYFAALKAMDTCIKALDYAEHYKYHDLVKDPKDLPEDGADVLVRTDYDYIVCKYRSNLREFDCSFFDDEDGGGFVTYDSECGYFKFLNVIGWAYFPLYEVKKE